MQLKIRDAYIIDAIRTPVGKAPRGQFRNVRPDDLLAHVLRGLLKKVPNLDPKRIADVVIGCAMPEAEQGMNVARIALLLAGLPDSVAGMTVNRFCASGLEAVSIAADRIRLGQADVMIAGGTESMSMIPMMGHRPSFNPKILNDDENVGIAYGMGLTAEKVAQQWSVTRESQDAFAYSSHQKALAAIKAGAFKREILPYETTRRRIDNEQLVLASTPHRVSQDEGPRADSTLEALAKLRTVFSASGTVTAGNSSQMSDGAGAVLMASESAIKQYKLDPIARFVGYAVAGVKPEIMGIGPIEAIPKVLKQTGIKQSHLDWIELNEAFAAQSLAVIQELKLDPEKVNPQGGAIALGHPLGATGAIRTATLVHALRREKLKYGMVTMCVGTGMGAAGIFERV